MNIKTTTYLLLVFAQLFTFNVIAGCDEEKGLAIDVEAARALVYAVARTVDSGVKNISMESAMSPPGIICLVRSSNKSDHCQTINHRRESFN